MDHTTFISHNARPAIRIERTLGYPASHVWEALNIPEQTRHWFPSELTVEPRVGGVVRFSGDPNTADSTGTVLAFDRPRLLAFTWGGNELRFDLTDEAPAETGFVLTNVLDADDEAARNAAGWDVCLAELERYLAGGETAGPHGESALSWQDRYDHFVALGLPSGAAIPGA